MILSDDMSTAVFEKVGKVFPLFQSSSKGIFLKHPFL